MAKSFTIELSDELAEFYCTIASCVDKSAFEIIQETLHTVVELLSKRLEEMDGNANPRGGG